MSRRGAASYDSVHPGVCIYPGGGSCGELWETRRVFQAARWNREAISKALWKTWGTDGDEARKFPQVFHRAVSRGSFHRTSARMKKHKGEEKEVVSELSGNIQGEDGTADERAGRNQRERVVGGSRSFPDIAFRNGFETQLGLSLWRRR